MTAAHKVSAARKPIGIAEKRNITIYAIIDVHAFFRILLVTCEIKFIYNYFIHVIILFLYINFFRENTSTLYIRLV